MRRRKGSAAESEQPVATEPRDEVKAGGAEIFEAIADGDEVEASEERADLDDADASVDENEGRAADEEAPDESADEGVRGEDEESAADQEGSLAADGANAVHDELVAPEDDEEVPTAGADAPPLAAVIEGVLFASAEPVPMRRLVRLLSSWSRDEVEQGVKDLRSGLEEADRGIRLVEAAGGLQLRSSERLAPWVRRFFAERPPRLSRPVLETLAIIAYRQPVTRGEVEQIRGVNCDAVLGALTTRGLIRIQGRRASPGRPAEYGTTDTFLELFTLRDLGELPPLPDPTALANLVVGENDDEAFGDESEGGSDAEGAGDEASVDASSDTPSSEGAAPEDPESGGDGLAEDGGGSDPERPGAGERPGGSGARDEGGSDPGSDHG